MLLISCVRTITVLRLQLNVGPLSYWGSIKLNINGSVNHHIKISGIGVVFHDMEGRMLMTFSSKISTNHPIEAEHQALYKVCKCDTGFILII